MAKYDLNRRFYKYVPPSSSEIYDYVPLEGENILIENVGISSSSSPETVGHICWDILGTPEIMISSYGEVDHKNIEHQIIGDGIKILRITLTNDLTQPAFLGGFYQGVMKL